MAETGQDQRSELNTMIVRQFQQTRHENGRKHPETDSVAGPLTAERLAAGEFKMTPLHRAEPDPKTRDTNRCR
jgi:hypothetical protein